MDIEKLKEWANTQNIGTANMSYHKAQEHVLEIINESNQSATSEEVAEAIEWHKNCLQYYKDEDKEIRSHYGGNLPSWVVESIKASDVSITALQAYQPTTRKNRTVEEVAEAIESALCLFKHCDEAQKWPGTYYSEDVKTAITALQAYQPWIPVSERMPTEGEFVLCYCEKYGVIEASYQFEQWWLDDDSWTATGVTHWKPLPEPPKGE